LCGKSQRERREISGISQLAVDIDLALLLCITHPRKEKKTCVEKNQRERREISGIAKLTVDVDLAFLFIITLL
jgi:hypothetical protein